MQPYYLEYNEEEFGYTIIGPDGFEWWIDEEVFTPDLNLNEIIRELNMLYAIIGGTDDGTV